MSDNPLDGLQLRDRIWIRAVLVRNGEDPGPALAAVTGRCFLEAPAK